MVYLGLIFSFDRVTAKQNLRQYRLQKLIIKTNQSHETTEFYQNLCLLADFEPPAQENQKAYCLKTSQEPHFL